MGRHVDRNRESLHQLDKIRYTREYATNEILLHDKIYSFYWNNRSREKKYKYTMSLKYKSSRIKISTR